MRAVFGLFASALSLAVSLGFVECERTPAEESLRAAAPPAPRPAPALPTPSSSAEAASADDGRCVRPLPRDPPAAPPKGPDPRCPPDPQGSPTLPIVPVTFADVAGLDVSAELASDPHDTARGLMYRTNLAEGRGMLFDLRARQDHQFWMHNTCIPLDLLFIDEDGLIVGIVESAPTLNDDSRGVGCPSRFVLEVNAGWSRRHGVRPGQRVRLGASR